MGQSLTCLHCHIIFAAKNRSAQITDDLRQRLYDYIGGIVRAENGQLLAAGGTAEHVHLLVRLHAQLAVADLLRKIKANSSKWVHETFSDKKGFAWQTGYGAFAVSRSNLDGVRHYIDRQEEHHRNVSFQEEYVRFLQRHGIEYDERYVWD